MFASGEPWWPGILIGALAQKSRPLAYLWIERCVRALLPFADTPNRRQLLADLQAGGKGPEGTPQKFPVLVALRGAQPPFAVSARGRYALIHV
jgi:hypothetical protein